MDNSPQQRFCTNCGQPLPPGTAFCVACGMQVGTPPTSAPSQFPAGAQPGYVPPYAQVPAQDDQLLDALAAGYVASRMGRNRPMRSRRRRFGLRGCGCLLLVLAVLAGPFVGVALTSGRIHVILTYVAGGMVVVFLLLLLIGILVTRRGRAALVEGSAEGCLDTILGGLFGG